MGKANGSRPRTTGRRLSAVFAVVVVVRMVVIVTMPVFVTPGFFVAVFVVAADHLRRRGAT
jgi:hypothetical protein